MQDIVCVGSTL
ncbi:hypothetical protein GEMRC1_010929 [Eukaryota sp. GEM-RC1]